MRRNRCCSDRSKSGGVSWARSISRPGRPLLFGTAERRKGPKPRGGAALQGGSGSIAREIIPIYAGTDGLGVLPGGPKRAGEAEPFFREALDLRRRTGPGWQSASAESDLAACLIAEHKYYEARPLLERSLPELAQAVGEHSREAEAARRRLVQLRGHA